MDVAGKNALITGGAGGIGRALARRLLRAGARVALWDVAEPAVAAARRELAAEGTVFGQALDVSRREEVASAARALRRDFGEIDILDNNAGVVYSGDFLSCPEEELERTFAVNVSAVMWCTREFLPGMIERGRGHVVMMASASGLLGVPGMAAYSASKHAVIGLSESIRLELRRQKRRGVALTIVCPSFVRTGMFAGVRAPLLAPWLEPDSLAEKILQAIVKEKLYVREPFLVKLIPLLKGLGGAPLLDRTGDLLGMHAAMDRWTGRGDSKPAEGRAKRNS